MPLRLTYGDSSTSSFNKIIRQTLKNEEIQQSMGTGYQKSFWLY
ncbi:MAG: hypothetical protein ACJAUP_000241 [Cellvibrionaceae bacterium]|jgi:hypothetical protein